MQQAQVLAGPITVPSHYVPSPGENTYMLSYRSFQLEVVARWEAALHAQSITCHCFKLALHSDASL